MSLAVVAAFASGMVAHALLSSMDTWSYELDWDIAIVAFLSVAIFLSLKFIVTMKRRYSDYPVVDTVMYRFDYWYSLQFLLLSLSDLFFSLPNLDPFIRDVSSHS